MVGPTPRSANPPGALKTLQPASSKAEASRIGSPGAGHSQAALDDLFDAVAFSLDRDREALPVPAKSDLSKASPQETNVHDDALYELDDDFLLSNDPDGGVPSHQAEVLGSGESTKLSDLPYDDATHTSTLFEDDFSTLASVTGEEQAGDREDSQGALGEVGRLEKDKGWRQVPEVTYWDPAEVSTRSSP